MKTQLPEIVRSGITLVLVLFCGFQIFRMWKAFLERVPVKNPLFPEHLEVGIRNYIVFFTVIYLIVAAANVWSSYAKKAFYVVTVVSVIVIISIQLLYPSIINFFLNHA